MASRINTVPGVACSDDDDDGLEYGTQTWSWTILLDNTHDATSVRTNYVAVGTAKDRRPRTAQWHHHYWVVQKCMQIFSNSTC